MTDTKSPFTLNHGENSLEKITGVSAEVAETIFAREPYGDLRFATQILRLMKHEGNAAFILQMFLEPLVDVDLSQPSRVTVYLVNSIQGEKRKKLVDKLDEILAGCKECQKKRDPRVTVVELDSLEDLPEALDKIIKGKLDEQR